MGFFDEIFTDLKSVSDDLQGIKDEFISSVVDPTGELKDTVTGIANDLMGVETPASEDASSNEV